MRVFVNYLALEYKTCFRALIKSLKYMIVFLGLVLCGIYALTQLMQNSQQVALLEVGLVLGEDDNETAMIARFASAMASVKSICEMQYLDEEEAIARLQDGSLETVIVFPESFYKDIDTGVNTPVTIYLPKDSTLNVEMFRELVNDAVSLLQVAEAGVYATLDAATETDIIMEIYEVDDLVAYKYIGAALERSSLFDQIVTSPIGEVDYYQYYFVSAMMIFLLLTGMSFGSLYKRQSRVIEQKLYVCGVRTWKLTVIKISVMATCLWAIALLWYVGGCVVSGYLRNAFLYWDFLMVWKLLFLCVCMASFFHMIYGISGGNSLNVITLLAANIGMILCSGLVVPFSYLPVVAQNLGSLLPLRIWQTCSIQALFDGASSAGYVIAFMWLCASTIIGGIALWKSS